MSDAVTYLIVRTGDGLVVDAQRASSPGDVHTDGYGAPVQAYVLTPALAAQGVWLGWIRQADGSYVDPSVPVAGAPTPAALMGYANARRKALAGDSVLAGTAPKILPVTIASGTYGFPVDATTRAALGDGAFQTTLPGGDQYVIPDWLLPNGQFIALDAPSIMTVAKAVAAAFQALFTQQAQAFAAIAAGTATTTAQVDAILVG